MSPPRDRRGAPVFDAWHPAVRVDVVETVQASAVDQGRSVKSNRNGSSPCDASHEFLDPAGAAEVTLILGSSQSSLQASTFGAWSFLAHGEDVDRLLFVSRRMVNLIARPERLKHQPHLAARSSGDRFFRSSAWLSLRCRSRFPWNEANPARRKLLPERKL